MDTILFYITEYFFYAIFLIIVTALFIFKIRKCETFEEQKQLIIILLIIYSATIGFVGALVKPYFTNVKPYRYSENNISYNFRGTGSFVNPNIVMTNYHVIEDCKEVAVRDYEKTYKGKVISFLKRSDGDIAFIETQANKKTFALLSLDEPKIGEIILYPNYSSKPGIFDKIKGKITSFDDETISLISPHGRRGNSGSPIYNKNGYLIGIVHSYEINLFVGKAIASPVKLIKKLADGKVKIDLYGVKDQKQNLTKLRYFYENYAVGVLCAQ